MIVVKNKKRLVITALAVWLCVSVAGAFFTSCDQSTGGKIEDPDDDDTDDPTDPSDDNINYASTTPSLTGSDFDAASYTGKLKSNGGTVTGQRYFIDAAAGDDTKDGKSVANAWKSFKNVNSAADDFFKPGDAILLEANSTWNGDSVSAANRETLLTSDKAGIIVLKGNGTAENPILLDFYVNNNGTAGYESARRPIINGNGTPSAIVSEPYKESGAIHVEASDYWHIRNIEVTNSFVFPQIANDPSKADHWKHQTGALKMLAGITTMDTLAHTHCKGILIEYCYVHDVQSAHSNNQTGPMLSSIGGTSVRAGKTGGGILVRVTNSTVQYNVVERVEYVGIRTQHGDSGYEVVFRGNYIESVYGDGMVMSRVRLQSGGKANLVESNVIKDSCAGDHGTGNFAANWNYFGQDIVYQYNETYGTMYGYLDGEAWDVDNDGKRIIYQYNYSHHNAGGAILFMNSGLESPIFRYNISANDGGGTRYMATIADADGALQVNTSQNSYAGFENGQSLIHYTISGGSTGAQNIPLVHNNTFYIGDGVSTAIYGNTSSGAGTKYVRFYNNVLLKAGKGTLMLSNTHNPGNFSEGRITNDTGFKGNLLWAYDTDPEKWDGTKITHGSGGTSISTLVSNTYGNVRANPKLKIQIAGNQSGNAQSLRNQRDSAFPDTVDPAAIKAYTGVERMRRRASLFSPIDATSPVLKNARAVKFAPGTQVNEVDGARVFNIPSMSEYPDNWSDTTGMTKDIFGSAIDPENPPIGAVSALYNP